MNYKDELDGITSRRRTEALQTAFYLFSNSCIEMVSMTDVAKKADIGVASLYRYFGTKLNLCIEVYKFKWREYKEYLNNRFLQHDLTNMTAYEQFGKYIDCFIDMNSNNQDFLRFNSNFAIYVKHEVVNNEKLISDCKNVIPFKKLFNMIWDKAIKDGSMRTDIPKNELYLSTLYLLMAPMQMMANAVNTDGVDNSRILQNEKDMWMRFISADIAK